VIATWSLVVVVSVFAGFIQETLKQQRAGDPDISILGMAEDASYEAVIGSIAEVPGIAATAPRLVWFGLLYREGDQERLQLAGEKDVHNNDRFFRIIGIDWQREQEVVDIDQWLIWHKDARPQELSGADPEAPFTVDPDHILRNLETQFPHEWPGILMSLRRAGMSNTLSRGASRGILTRVLTGRRDNDGLEVHQLEFVTSGAYQSGYYDLDETTAFVDIDALRVVFGQSEYDENPIDVFNEISVRVNEGEDPDEICAVINDALAKSSLPGRAFTWEQRKARFLEAIAYERSMTKFVLLVLLVIAMFLVFAATSTMVAEKTRDIGTLSALGATRGGLLVIFMFSGLVIAILGSAFGISLGLLTLDQLNPINRWLYAQGIEMFPRAFLGDEGIPHVRDYVWYGQVAVGAIISSLFFSFLPAWRAARLDPVQALRYE
jgi:ABC-type lipoprotein release transport system permease subunit